MQFLLSSRARERPLRWLLPRPSHHHDRPPVRLPARPTTTTRPPAHLPARRLTGFVAIIPCSFCFDRGGIIGSEAATGIMMVGSSSIVSSTSPIGIDVVWIAVSFSSARLPMCRWQLCTLRLRWYLRHSPFFTAITSVGTMSPYSPHATSITVRHTTRQGLHTAGQWSYTPPASLRDTQHDRVYTLPANGATRHLHHCATHSTAGSTHCRPMELHTTCITARHTARQGLHTAGQWSYTPPASLRDTQHGRVYTLPANGATRHLHHCATHSTTGSTHCRPMELHDTYIAARHTARQGLHTAGQWSYTPPASLRDTQHDRVYTLPANGATRHLHHCATHSTAGSTHCRPMELHTTCITARHTARQGLHTAGQWSYTPPPSLRDTQHGRVYTLPANGATRHLHHCATHSTTGSTHCRPMELHATCITARHTARQGLHTAGQWSYTPPASLRDTQHDRVYTLPANGATRHLHHCATHSTAGSKYWPNKPLYPTSITPRHTARPNLNTGQRNQYTPPPSLPDTQQYYKYYHPGAIDIGTM